MAIGRMRTRSGWQHDFAEVARYHAKMNAQTPGKLSKFQRYRANKKARGLKEVRLWVPDVKSPQFKAQMALAEKEYRGLPKDPELDAFMEANLADVLKDMPKLPRLAEPAGAICFQLRYHGVFSGSRVLQL